MKTVIVPTDFSAIAENALNYAVEFAKQTGCSLLLFHVYQVPVSVTDVPIVLISVEDLKKNADNAIQNLKSSVEQSVSGSINISAEAKLGDTIDELQAICNREKPFAVIMGTKGAGALERVFFGSTTIAAVKHVSCPVIIVPPEKKYTAIKRVGFACDFRQVADTTPVVLISNFVKEFRAELYVLNVHYKNAKINPQLSEESLLLRAMLKELNPAYDFIEDENVEAGIEKFAASKQLDLIITIPKKHKLLASLFTKSHTKKLIFHSHLPIMCVHE